MALKTSPKSRGTQWESWLVNRFKGIGLFSQRIAEGGSKDRGDLEVVLDNGMTFVVEAKAMQTLNVTRVLNKARIKSGDGIMCVLAWKRLVKLKEGQQKRRPDGEPMVVVLGLDTFELLLTLAGKK